jgi:hypothetical protein
MSRVEDLEKVIKKMLDEKYNISKGVRTYYADGVLIDMSEKFNKDVDMDFDVKITEKVHLDGKLIYDEGHIQKIADYSAGAYIEYDMIWFSDDDCDYIGMTIVG